MNLPLNAVSDGGNGVIHMGLLNIIRRMALREKQSIREISRRTGLSRNTIAKYLNAGTIEPTFTVPERPSKLDPFADKLTAWLKTETGKSRKQRRTLKQLHADLVSLGFTGSYGRVAAFARDWRADRQREQQTTGRGIFVPLSFRPGEAFQFDWSEDYAVIGGERTKLQVAHIKLSHSRAFLVRAYLLQTHEMLFDAHWHGFRVFGGVPGRGIYDNMKTAVDRVGRGNAPAAPAPAPATPAPAPAPDANAAAPSVTNSGTCPSCGAPTLPTDVFCEACGADLAGGAPLPTTTAAGSSPTGTSVEVRVDRAYFDAFVEAGALQFPDPEPVAVLLPVTKDELLVGRRSDSRGVFPDVDAQKLTADPAVSHAHALLRRDGAGGWSVTDQGSTNGSRLDRSADLLVPGRAYPLPPDAVLHVGAWTSIRIVTDPPQP